MRVLWKESPLGLQAFVVVSFVWSLVAFAFNPNLPLAVGIPFELVISYFLLRRVRWLWLATVVLGFLTLLLPPYNAHWYIYPLSIATLVLLVLPDTRRYFAQSTRPGPAGALNA